MVADVIRIGIIGAGAFTTGRILPGFQQNADGVQVTLVANRRRESAERVAEQFGLQVADDYRAILDSSQVDAVLVGTPPNVHKEIVLAALDAGKHVLCQTRIAMDVAEAREMQRAAEAAKARGIQTMLVPPGPYYRASAWVAHLIDSGFIGELRHVHGFNLNASMADSSVPLDELFRADPTVYGTYNALQLGLSYDVMARWTGHATSLVAQRAFFTPRRPATRGAALAETPYPEEVTVVADTESGAVMTNLVNYAAYFGDPRIELYGERGTLVYRGRGDEVLGAQAGDKDGLRPLPIPPEHDQPWRIEDEFARLIRGEIDTPSFTFADGVKNMAYLEAAYRSAVEGQRVGMESLVAA